MSDLHKVAQAVEWRSWIRTRVYACEGPGLCWVLPPPTAVN